MSNNLSGGISQVKNLLVNPVVEARDAYQLAKLKDPSIGTLDEWLASLVGDDGLSAFEIAVVNGFVGTEEEWIASLEGPQPDLSTDPALGDSDVTAPSQKAVKTYVDTNASAAFHFLGAVDGDWGTLGNWFRNAAGTIPAPTLPGIEDPVVLHTSITTLGADRTVGSMDVRGYGASLDATDFALTVTGKALFSGVSASNFGTINGNVEFSGQGGGNAGMINGDAIFSGYGTSNTEDGTVLSTGWFRNVTTDNLGTAGIVKSLADLHGAQAQLDTLSSLKAPLDSPDFTGPLTINDITSAASGSLAGAALAIAQTWNTTGTPTAFKLDVTDTASAAGSLLMDLRVGGSSKFKIVKNTNLVAGYYLDCLGVKIWNRSGSAGIMGVGGAGFNGLEVASHLGFSNASGTSFGGADTFLFKEGVCTLGMWGGSYNNVPSTFLIYNTKTNASNYERLSLKANAGGAFEIKSEAAGTGVVRDIAISDNFTITKNKQGQQGVKIGLIPNSDYYVGLNILDYWGNSVGSFYGDNAGGFHIMAGGLEKFEFSSITALMRGNINAYVLVGNSDATLTGGTETVRLWGYYGDGISFTTGTVYERMRITNAGNIGIGTDSPVSKLSVLAGDIEAETIGNGVILKSANGTRWRITIDNTGALTSTAL